MVLVTGFPWLLLHQRSWHERLNDHNLVLSRDSTIARFKGPQFVVAIAIDRSASGDLMLAIVKLDGTKSDGRAVFKLHFSRRRISRKLIRTAAGHCQSAKNQDR